MSQSHEVLNIPDLLNDPFSSISDWNVRYKSALIVPIVVNGDLIAVVEFYRKKRVFDGHDEKIAGKVAAMLAGIPSYSYVFNLPEPVDENEMKLTKVRYVSSELSRLRVFNVVYEKDNGNFCQLVNNIQDSIKQLMPMDHCTLYIANN